MNSNLKKNLQEKEKKDNPPKKNNKRKISNEAFNNIFMNIKNEKKEIKKGIKGKKIKRSKKDLKTKTKKIEKINNKDIIKYTDEELNLLSYKLAIQYDKRTYLQYYISLLKTKHNFVFTFFNSNDYNSRIIKIDLFFIGFIIYLSVNALFFNDDTIHQIYKSKGIFDLEYQIPKILYSSLISIVLNTLL